MPDHPITVSETANWVAMYRAIESERPDAVFHDAFARALAGQRGEQILREMPAAKRYGWPMVVRTAVMDEIIVRLAPTIDAVLNLAAGLDARPYRLPLPPALRWIEVDFPATLAYKAGVLAGVNPVCTLERVPMDLADRAARVELFARIGSEVKRALVVTEGLLVYLSAEQVGLLADDLRAQPTFKWWLTDVAAPWVLRLMQRTWGRSVRAGGSPFQFAPDDAGAFFAQHGWRVAEYRSNMIEGERIKRFPLAWLFRLLRPSMWREEITRRSGPMVGVVLLENAGAGS